MQIFQNQQNRIQPGQIDEKVPHRCKERRLIGDRLHRSAGERTRRLRKVSVLIQIAEQIDPRTERRSAIELKTTGFKHPHISIRGVAGERADKGGFADACFATDDDNPAIPIDRRRKVVQERCPVLLLADRQHEIPPQ